MTGRHPRVTIIGLNYLPEPTGIAPYTSGLASGLANSGWKVRAITSFPHYPAWEVADGYVGAVMRESLEGVRVTRLRPYMPKNPSGVKRLLVELAFGAASSFTRWGNPQVVILVSPALFATAIALIRARLTRGRPEVIVWVQDLYSVGVTETATLGSGGARIMAIFEARVLRSADIVVVIHDRFKRFVSSTLGVAPSAVKVVRNWTHIVPVSVDRLSYRSRFGWGDDIVVLHAGNMGAKQALENVVEAARLADQQERPVRFVLLGNGNQRERLIAMSQGITRLDFMDSLDDATFQGAMGAADILLVNEKRGVTEMAVPSKLTSYFAAERPVIVATDAGSITAEEVEVAGAGIRVDAGDPSALLDAVLDLGSDPSRAALLGKSGGSFQKRVLSQSNAISHYAEIINSLAGKRSL
jgi:colanic acid biosynthesis glycosyl transferase WcaI